MTQLGATMGVCSRIFCMCDESLTVALMSVSRTERARCRSRSVAEDDRNNGNIVIHFQRTLCPGYNCIKP